MKKQEDHIVSKNLVNRFARWALSNGCHTESGTTLIAAIRNESPIIGARIMAVVANSSVEFGQDLLLKTRDTFSAEEIAAILSTPRSGPYQWVD